MAVLENVQKCSGNEAQASTPANQAQSGGYASNNASLGQASDLGFRNAGDQYLALGLGTYNSMGCQASGYLIDTSLKPKTPDPVKLETIPTQYETKQVTRQIVNTELFEVKFKAFQEQLSVAQLALKADVKYDFAKDKMDDKTKAALGEVAKAINMLDKMPGMDGKKFTIDGHTDSKGENRGYDNVALSKRRAENLKAALVEMGVNPDRIETVGHGASQPIAENKITNASGHLVDNPAGRALNRRAELGFTMTEAEYKTSLLKAEAQLRKESVTTVTEQVKSAIERPEVRPLTSPMSIPGPIYIGTPGPNASPEVLREIRVFNEKQKTQTDQLTSALEKLASQNIDLKIKEYKGEPYNLALRVEKDKDYGGYHVSIYSPHNGNTLHTTNYSQSGKVQGYAGTRTFFPDEAIQDGIRKWAGY